MLFTLTGSLKNLNTHRFSFSLVGKISQGVTPVRCPLYGYTLMLFISTTEKKRKHA